MLFHPQCAMGKEVFSAKNIPISAVYSDLCGALWAVHTSGTSVFYFSQSTVAEMMLSFSKLSATAEAAAEKSEISIPIFECGERDSVLVVVFPTSCATGRSFACIATTKGHLLLSDIEFPECVRHRADIGAQVTAVVAITLDKINGVEENSVGVLAAVFDGTFSEVLFVLWGGGDNMKAVSATGLFRIRGYLHVMLFDDTCERIVTVTRRGDVDVWNWQKGVDETILFGMPAYNVEEYGEPSCGALLDVGQLWIGTTTGHIVVFALRHAASDALPRKVWQAHAGNVAVRSILSMSFGRHVWSYADDMQALVWDAEGLTLLGSFQFSGEGFSGLYLGLCRSESIVWGINNTTGAATWFTVKEPLLCANRHFSFLKRNECVTRRLDVERYHVLGTLVSDLCLQLAHGEASDEAGGAGCVGESGEGDRADVGEGKKKKKISKEREQKKVMVTTLTPPHIDVALQQLDDDYPKARLLPAAMRSFVSARLMVRQALLDAGMHSRSFLEDIVILLQEQRQHRELQAQVSCCLDKIRRELPRSEMCDSLDDVADTVRSLLRRIEQRSPSASSVKSSSGPVSRGLWRVGSGSAQRATEVVSPLVEAHDTHVRRLEESLTEEKLRRQKNEAQIVELDDERRELQARLAQSMRLQEECEGRVASLKRLLRTAKKAAEVTSTEAARLSELEANLHDAHCTIEALHGKVESLMRERQEASEWAQENKALIALIRRFEAKEQIARQAFEGFVETENHVLDVLEGVLQDDSAEEVETHPDIAALYDWLCCRAEKQHELFLELRRGFANQLEKDGR